MTRSTTQQSDRQAFEEWLLDVHLLTGTWDYTRNCYVEFPCHLAHKAWCASAQRFGESKQSERLAVVTDEAITAFNASPLIKQNGGLLASVHPTVGRANRQAQVKRCVKVARDICRVSFESEIITPEFWEQFFAICHGDDFLAGRGPKSPGHEGWVSNFEYLTRPATMLKVFEKSEAA